MPTPTALHRLTASDAARRIAAGELTSEALVRACLERIEEREPAIRAWAHLDPARTLAEARERDRTKPKGPLHGVPIGVKDIIDTGDMPTERGSPIYRGHRPARDADCVARARAAGAVVMGKTATTEFAYIHPAPTRNPLNTAYTPGGSSSGSTAAVADCMIPLALGTQTGGSTIRPAANCGNFGFKPTYNRVSVAGVKPLAVSFDTVGMIGRSVDDLALLDSALTGAPALRPGDRRQRSLRIGYCETPFWNEAEDSTRRALANAAETLLRAGVRIEEVTLPAEVRELSDGHPELVKYETAFTFRHEYAEHREQMSSIMRASVETGLALAANDMQRVRRVQTLCSVAVDRLVSPLDALLTPTAPGEPEIGDAVGNNVFNRIWTAMHMPCLTIPSSTGPSGMPVGVQLVGRAGHDRALLAVGRRVAEDLLA